MTAALQLTYGSLSSYCASCNRILYLSVDIDYHLFARNKTWTTRLCRRTQHTEEGSRFERASAVGEAMEEDIALVTRFNFYEGRISVEMPKRTTATCVAADICYMRSGSVALGLA